MNMNCAYNEKNDIFHVVRGNDFPIRICLWSKGLTFGQDRAYELEDCSEIMAKVVGSDRKVAVKARFVTTNEIRGLVETGSLPIGDYGVEVVFVNGSGIKKRILQHGVIRVASCNDASGVQEDSCIVNLYVDKETSGGGDVPDPTPGESCKPDSELSETSENCVQNRVVTGAIRELQDYCFPTLLEASISPSSAEWTGNSVEVSVSFRVLRNSKPVVADTVQIQFNGETKTLENVAEGSEKFTLSTLGYKSGSVTAKKGSTTIKNSPWSISANLYLPVYYGFSKATTGNELIIASLTKGGSSLNGTKTLTNDDATKYLWLCVPNTMSINKVTSSGFDVPFLAPVEASTPLGTYKCYRTKDLPGTGSMTIVIS